MITIIEDNEELIDLLDRFVDHLEDYPRFDFESEEQRQELTDKVEEAFEALRRLAQSEFGKDRCLGYRDSQWGSHHKLREAARGAQDIVGARAVSGVPSEVQKIAKERDRLKARVQELEEKLQAGLDEEKERREEKEDHYHYLYA